MRAAWMHAGAILRGAWRATLVLAVLAGVAGGLVLAGWSAVRRGTTALDRFEQSVGEADLTVSTCGPDGHFDLDSGGCAVPYLPFAERDRIAAIPGVEAAGVGAIFPLWYSGPKLPEDASGGVWAMADGSFPTALGKPVVVDGRMFDPTAADEVLITEDVVSITGIGVGDTLTVRGYPHDQGIDLQAPAQGEEIPVRVVGVVRFPTDLSPRRTDEDVELVESNPLLTPAWFERYGRHLAAFSTAVFVRFEPDIDPTAAVAAALDDQEVLLTPTDAESDVDTVYDAIRYESGVVTAVTLAAALAAIVVVGLAIARQAAEEQDEPLVLAAIGATRRQRAGASALRSIPVALGATVVGAATAIATSAWTPIGLARRAEVDTGLRVDAVPLAVGLPIVAAIVAVAFAAPTLRRRGTARRTTSSIGTVAAAAGCSPQMTTGMVLAFPGGARRAGMAPVIAGALAAAAVVSAAMLVGGLDYTLADPVRYGAPWDAIIDSPVGIEQERALIEALRADERITDAAGQLYTEATIGGKVTLVHALDPVLGQAITPVIVDGREPVRPGEIALGGVLMGELGVGIGDTIPVELLTALEPTVVEAKVVGQAIVNDGFSAEAGDGGLVLAEWGRELAPGAFAQTFAVRMAPGRTIDDLDVDYATVSPVVPQKGLANLRRIQSLPWLLAAAVAALAVGAMVHTLSSGIRNAAPQLATLRALGFTRRQLRSSVRWGAIFVAVCAALLGIPLGLIAGRWGWRTLGASVGVATEAPLPVLLGAATAAGLIALAVVSAIGPAARAGRQDPVAFLDADTRTPPRDDPVMRLPQQGRPVGEVIDELRAKRGDDVRWADGRAFSLVYDGGQSVHDAAEQAARLYLHENALNTLAFPSLGQIQSEVVGWTAGLLHAPDTAAGFLTSGGTESIQCAVLAARERGRAERGITAPEIVVAESAHAAFHKSAHLFGMRIVTTPVGADWTADVDAMADAVGPNTVLVVGSAPQYPQGVIDPIPAIAAVAASVDANCHVDACMGGFVLPFAELLGREVSPWDFRVDGVHSISADIHKLGYAPKGVSVILHRTKQLRKYQTFTFDGWLGGFYASPNLQGTRSGLPMAAAWAVMQHLGVDGYTELTRGVLDAADRMRAGIAALDGVDVLGDGRLHVVAMAGGPRVDVFAVGDELARRGWYLDRQGPPDSLHATVSNSNVRVMDDYLADLASSITKVVGSRSDDRSTNYATLE